MTCPSPAICADVVPVPPCTTCRANAVSLTCEPREAEHDAEGGAA